MPANILFTTALLVAAVLAEGPSVRVAVEANGSSGLQNTTVNIPLNSIYKNTNVLQGVSALYVVGASGTQMDGVFCTPYFNAQGSGKHAVTFSSSSPTHISGTDDFGSIVCISTSISLAPAPLGGSSSSSAPPFGTQTSTTLVTHTPRPQGTHTTAGSGYTVSSHSNSGPTAASASASPTASQSAGNAASALYLSGEFFGGLALAGFGVAFAL